MFLSIIVPVYNVEKYIERCMDSVMEQNSDEIEIIIVEDGSTDHSPSICDRYQKYPNIKVIHQENRGLSAARNVGIQNAAGEYLLFLDSDDFLVAGSLSPLISGLKKEKCDVFFGRAYRIDEHNDKRNKTNYAVGAGHYSSREFLSQLEKYPQSITFCAQFYLCSRAFVLKNELAFEENILHEDEIWTPDLILHAEDIYVSDLYFYYHYTREGSITHNKENYEHRGKSLLHVCAWMQNRLKDFPEADVRILYDRIVALYLIAVDKLQGNIPADQVLDRRWVLQRSVNPYTKRLAILYFGPKQYAFVHPVLVQIHKMIYLPLRTLKRNLSAWNKKA